MGSRLNYFKSLDFVGSVEAGGNPRVHVDGGVTIEEVVIETNLNADEFYLIVELDGDLRVKVSGQQMLDREAYDGRASTAGQFVFSFAAATAKTIGGEAATSMVTQVGQRVLFSLEIGGAVDAAEPSANLHIETSHNRTEEYRLYVLPETVKITQAGENDYDGFRKSRRRGHYYMRRLFAYGAVSKFRLEQDDFSVFGKRNMSVGVSNARLKRNGKVPPALCFVYDAIVKGNVLADLLDLFVVQSPTRATFTTTSANDLKALVEYVEDVRVQVVG